LVIPYVLFIHDISTPYFVVHSLVPIQMARVKNYFEGHKLTKSLKFYFWLKA
jgi:hypothetical protein